MHLEGKENIGAFCEKMIQDCETIDVTPTGTMQEGEKLAAEYTCRLA